MADAHTLTVWQVIDAMNAGFPGAVPVTRVGAGVTHVLLQVWQFEILFSVTTASTIPSDPPGQGTLFLKQRLGSELASIRQIPAHNAVDAKEAIESVKRHLNGVVASILSACEI
jgi:hypothetical protein